MQLKKYALLFFLLFIAITVFSQTAERIKYKAVAASSENPSVADMDSVKEWILDTLHFGGGMIDTNSIRFVGNPVQSVQLNAGLYSYVYVANAGYWFADVA